MSANTVSPLQNELVTFIQHQLPGLENGVYRLAVSQWVNDKDDKAISGILENEYEFAVQGDRFAVSNPALVDSVFPADNATGEFGTILPHVVLTNTTFPWSRTPRKPALEETAEPDVATWLAVLIFDEDDGLESLIPTASKIGNLFPKSVWGDSTLLDNYSYFYNAKAVKLEPGQTVDDPIQTLDIPLAQFWTLAPTFADLKLLAHVRKVNMLTKATLAGTIGPGQPTGTYSIVFGNRLPQSSKPPLVGKKTFAFLVSLEGLEEFLPADDGTAQPGNQFDGSKLLRLAVLNNWVFYSVGESATFVNTLLSLNGREDPDGPVEAENTNLRLPYHGTNEVVKAALDMGFAPLNTDLRTAEETVSWYRGPLTPYEVGDSKIKIPVSSADEANRFDPTTGMIDQSYGAAWTLGRLMAIQDPAFSAALYNWKTGLTQHVVDQIEDELLHEKFGTMLDAGPVPLALEGRRTGPAGSLLHKTIQAIGRQG
jgi:hypothetical protein